MIETLYKIGELGSLKAFIAALVIGFVFGFVLERAGFGSSRKLTGIFYFRDMSVAKVMLAAMLVSVLGICYARAAGWIDLDSIYLMPTIYGAQMVGGLIFGIGFVLGGWCPGTATVGFASGKFDALVFLVGTVVGSIFFNEIYAFVTPLYGLGNQGIIFLHDSLGIPLVPFVFIFALLVVDGFWMFEYIEKKRGGSGTYLEGFFLKAFSVALVVSASGLFVVSALLPQGACPTTQEFETQLMKMVEEGSDHIAPETLADRLMSGEEGLVVIDVRPPDEYRSHHLRKAENISLPLLAERLALHKNKGTIVLYSNGMTHPAQARDSLYRLGYRNVCILTDGFDGFVERCLKPVSLRSEPLTPDAVARINSWRAYFSTNTKD